MMSSQNIQLSDIQDRELPLTKLIQISWSSLRSQAREILFISLGFYLLPISVSIFTNNEIVIDLASVMADAFAAMGIAILVHAKIRDLDLDYGNIPKVVASKAIGVLWTYALAGIILTILAFLLILPAVIWAVYYSFLPYVIALRDKVGKAALDYSKSVVRGRWWRVAFIGVLLQVFAYSINWGFSRVSIILPSERDFLLVLYFLSIPVAAFIKVTMTIFFLNLDSLKDIVESSTGLEKDPD